MRPFAIDQAIKKMMLMHNHVSTHDTHLDMLRLQVINRLLILLCHTAGGRPAHKVLPCAAQPIAEARLPHGVGLSALPVASH